MEPNPNLDKQVKGKKYFTTLNSANHTHDFLWYPARYKKEQ